MTLTLT